jgi:hypothetical protein
MSNLTFLQQFSVKKLRRLLLALITINVNCGGGSGSGSSAKISLVTVTIGGSGSQAVLVNLSPHIIPKARWEYVLFACILKPIDISNPQSFYSFGIIAVASQCHWCEDICFSATE